MAHNKVVVDGQVMMDSSTGEWASAASPELQNALKPGSKPQPWMQAMLVAMAVAAVQDKPFSADVVTRPGGWTLDVTA